jgi:hypothetical protein
MSGAAPVLPLYALMTCAELYLFFLLGCIPLEAYQTKSRHNPEGTSVPIMTVTFLSVWPLRCLKGPTWWTLRILNETGILNAFMKWTLKG